MKTLRALAVAVTVMGLGACSSGQHQATPPQAAGTATATEKVASVMAAGGYGCANLQSYADANLQVPRFASDGAKCDASKGALWIVTFDDNQSRDHFTHTFAVGKSSGMVYASGDGWVVEAGSKAALKPAADALGVVVHSA